MLDKEDELVLDTDDADDVLDKDVELALDVEDSLEEEPLEDVDVELEEVEEVLL